jgi:short-subunit dehydrogenase
MTRQRNLDGRVVVVIGAASGIGAATAHLLARSTASLVLADCNEQLLVRQFEAVSSAREAVLAVGADVTDPSSLDRLVEQSLTRFGRVDAVVNCAGIIHAGPFQDTSPEKVRHQVDVNLHGTFNVTTAFLPVFSKQKAGQFVHVASLGGFAPLPYSAVYSATKFAVRGFCLSLGLELRNTPIDVSVVYPDSTDTPQLRQEAAHQGSPLSFIDAPLAASDVARAIIAALRRPKWETLVPRRAGLMSRIGGAWPDLLRIVYPVLQRVGELRRARYLRGNTARVDLHTRPRSVSDA